MNTSPHIPCAAALAVGVFAALLTAATPLLAQQTQEAPLPLAQEAPLQEALPAAPEGAQQGDAPAPPAQFNYALGLATSISPSYAGSDERKARLRPVLALQYGRFRLSSSRGSSVMRHGIDGRSSGASATLVERDRFNLSASLRLDNGRSASDAALLRGLPEVRTTLRGRLNMGYSLTDRWSIGASLSQDLLGRSGGADMHTGLQYEWNVTQQTRLNFGVGASLGNATFMRTQFGVPASAASQGSTLAPFAPGGGLYSVDAGMGVMTALSRHWVAFGSLGFSQLRGDARRSPLTVRPNTYSATAGIAYRCCR